MAERRKKTIPSDIGGEPAGAVDTVDHGMRFWERQANALRTALRRKGLMTVDELRRAAEDLGDYAKLEYFERTTLALRTVLLEKGYFTEQALAAKMAEVRKRFDVPRKKELPVKRKAKR
jgi:hypothetical protein